MNKREAKKEVEAIQKEIKAKLARLLELGDTHDIDVDFYPVPEVLLENHGDGHWYPSMDY